MSVGAYTPPVISVVLDFDDGMYRLHATSHGKTEPAGERLFRAEPWPRIQFSHTSQQTAEKDAVILRAYLSECASGKRKDKAPTMHIGRDYWMD